LADGVPRSFVIGTAGHIDHGKSSLVRCLTGVDPDRLPEERRRGITIDLGFAPVELPGGVHAAFVDVPGHERFVRTMVAGACGVDAVLLAVAADEGPMPQTLEHLAILRLLGLAAGVVALTKVDLVDAEWRALVAGELAAALAAGPLAHAPIVPVSTVTGEGLAALADALAASLAAAPPRPEGTPPRLAVDRVFAAPGFGTVVTGTLVAGRIAREDRLDLLPLGRSVRVRGLQVHGRPRQVVSAGERVAVNLDGVAHREVRRGDVLAGPGGAVVTRRAAAALTPLAASGRALRHGACLHLHVGTAEAMTRLVLLDGEVAEEDGCLARLALDRPVALQAGDRFILRGGAPLQTLGGGVVLDAVGDAYRRGRTASVTLAAALRDGGAGERLAAFLRQARSEPPSAQELALRAGVAPAVAAAWLGREVAAGRVTALPGGRYADAAAWRRAEEELVATVERFHREAPLRPGVPREELRRRAAPSWDGRRFGQWLEALALAGRLVLEGERVRLPAFVPVPTPAQAAALAAMEDHLARRGLEGEGQAALLALAGADGPDLLPLLVERGRAVRLPGGLVLGAEALTRARAVLDRLLDAGPVTAAAYRDALGISRRVAVPLLEYFDGIHVTRRQGDAHARRVEAPARADTA
jgi:selenocysteine-specific elongation factor